MYTKIHYYLPTMDPLLRLVFGLLVHGSVANSWSRLTSLDTELGRALTEAEQPFATMLRAGLKTAPSAFGNIPLEDIFFRADDVSTVRLHKLRLEVPWSLQQLELNTDLTLLSLDMSSDIESLNIEGDCGDSYRGNISVTLHHVTVSGVVALGLVGDNFVANYADFQYIPQEVVVVVTYLSSDSNPSTMEFSNSGIKGSLAEPFFDDVVYQLNSLVRLQLDQVLRNISLKDLLGNNEVGEKYKKYASQLKQNLNSVSDFILQAVKCATEVHPSMIMEDLNQEFSYPIRNGEALKRNIRGNFTATGGWFREATSLRRSNDVSLARADENFTVTCPLILEDSRLGYSHYKAWFGSEEATGKLEGQVKIAEITLKAILHTSVNVCKAELLILKVVYFQEPEVEMGQPTEMKWLQNYVITWIAGKMKGSVVPEVEGRLSAAVQQALSQFHCEQFI
ncbi:uncharacterized protein [Anabrus simplex]|uniref:uncharacterized protein n=1 Tax=Anabrus simplex TaxID=316456 RepID=UPI0035A2720D